MGDPRVHILRLVLLGLAALAGIVAGAAFLQKASRPGIPSPSLITSGGRGPPDAEIAAARRGLEERLKTAPEYDAFFDRLKSLFPAEYEAFLAAFSKRLATGGEPRSPDVLMGEAARFLRLSRGILAAKAGNPALEHIFELQASMLQALAAKDPRLCVNFLNGAETPGLFEFSAANRGLVTAMGIASIDAIHDGDVKQVDRPAPTGRDFAELEKALRGNGLGTPEIEALLDGKASDPPIADEKMCHAGQIYLETLAAMPEPSRVRIYGFAVEIMARS
jgi:hypothetical protein